MKTQQTKIAIVDDHPLVREHLSGFIRNQGFNVVFNAENGLDCLSRMATIDLQPDLCILDVRMPRMDGFATARQIRQTWPEIRILFYSTKRDSGTIEEALNSGGDAFLNKNCEPEEILDTIQSLLRRRDRN